MSLQQFDCLLGTRIDTCPTLLTEARDRVGHIVWPLLLPELSRTFKNGSTDSAPTLLRVTLYIIHRDFQFWLQHLSFSTVAVPRTPSAISPQRHYFCSLHLLQGPLKYSSITRALATQSLDRNKCTKWSANRASDGIIQGIHSPIRKIESGVMKTGYGLELEPIGIIHSPYKGTVKAPYQGHRSRKISQIEVFKEFEEGLKDIEGFSHIVVIFWFHQSHGCHLLVKTPWDDVLHGLFATRSPHRPCPLGLTVVELTSRNANTLQVRGLDATDGTPLLDIKPYIPSIDERPTVKLGWLEGKPGKKRC
jgi:tRNA-Thr(GGU) m(6)t(6)A37 methyltransferase TsaA